MLRNLCCCGTRLSCRRIHRKLFCRIFFIAVLRLRIGVIRIGSFVNLRYISCIVHSGNRKILIPGIKLLQADIHCPIRMLRKFIAVHIDCLDTGIRIMCLNTQKTVTDCRIQGRLREIKALDITVFLIGLSLLVSDLHINGAVLGNLHIHILCNVRPASILRHFFLYFLDCKVAGFYRIFHRNMYLCGIVMPSCRCGDCYFYTGIYIGTFLVVFTAYCTILVHLILAALLRTGTLR